MLKMQFSLVVTCYNEMRGLRHWQAEIKAQSRPPDEIVIVDSDSRDGTGEFLKAWAMADKRVRLIIQKCSPARGHNLGNEACAYEHIVSTDMGVHVDPHWFEEIIRPFEQDPSIDVVAGNYCIDKGSLRTAAARAEFYIENGGFARFGPGFVVGNRSVAYTKKVWRELAGLPEDLTRYADDAVFGRQILQAGYKVAFAPKAMVYWSRPGHLRQFWRETFNYGIGNGEAMIKVPIAFRLHQSNLLPAGLVPLLTSLRFFQKNFSFSAMGRSAANLDFATLFLMPFLLLGNGYSYGKGFLIGDARGRVHCTACRSRLAQNRASGLFRTNKAEAIRLDGEVGDRLGVRSLHD